MKVIKYIDGVSVKVKIMQKIWYFVSFFLFKPFVFNVFNPWRIFILRIFGAKIDKGSIVYSSVFIPAPWNLVMGKLSCLGPNVSLHIDKTIIGNKVTVSQGTYLCNGSHDITKLNKPFISAPIVLNDFSWIAAECFVAPGIVIGEGAVVGARAAVFKDVDSWTIVGGNPAKFIKKRTFEDS